MAQKVLPQRPLGSATLACLLALSGTSSPGCGECKEGRRADPGPTGTGSSGDASPPRGTGVEASPLKVSAVRLFGKGGERSPRLFARGEMLEIRALVSGLAARHRRVRLQASMLLVGPDQRIFDRRQDFAAVDQEVPPGMSTDRIEVSIRLGLSPASPPGDYRISLRLVDTFTERGVTEEVDIKVLAPSPSPTPGLSIGHLRPPPDLDLRAGLPLGLDFELAGLTARPAKAGQSGEAWTVKAVGEAELVDASGHTQLRVKRTLVDQTYPFPPALVPLHWPIELPSSLGPGSYLLRFVVKDAHGGERGSAEHRFRLLPGGLGIYSVRVSGAGSVPRASFLRGELMQVELVLAGWRSPADLELDLALVGPDGGFYLVRKGVHRVRKVSARPAHRPIRIPILVPELAPQGSWTLKLRLRSSTQRQEASRDVPFSVEGPPIDPLPSLRILETTLRHPPGGPPVSHTRLRAGQTYQVDLLVGGMKLRNEEGYYHRAELRCALRLRNAVGTLLASQEKACEVNRRFSFAPRRLRLSAEWTLPPGAVGARSLEVEVLDLLSNRVSVSQRPVSVARSEGHLHLPPRPHATSPIDAHR